MNKVAEFCDILLFLTVRSLATDKLNMNVIYSLNLLSFRLIEISRTARAATFTKFGKRLHKFQYPKRFRLNVTFRLIFFHYADR